MISPQNPFYGCATVGRHIRLHQRSLAQILFCFLGMQHLYLGVIALGWRDETFRIHISQNHVIKAANSNIQDTSKKRKYWVKIVLKSNLTVWSAAGNLSTSNFSLHNSNKILQLVMRNKEFIKWIKLWKLKNQLLPSYF